MMLGKWMKEVLGVEALVQELREERTGQRELMGEVMRTSQAQAEALKSMTKIMESIYRSYETDGTPPEGRHMSEEIEDQLLKEAFYGSDESDDGA